MSDHGSAGGRGQHRQKCIGLPVTHWPQMQRQRHRGLAHLFPVGNIPGKGCNHVSRIDSSYWVKRRDDRNQRLAAQHDAAPRKARQSDPDLCGAGLFVGQRVTKGQGDIAVIGQQISKSLGALTVPQVNQQQRPRIFDQSDIKCTTVGVLLYQLEAAVACKAINQRRKQQASKARLAGQAQLRNVAL